MAQNDDAPCSDNEMTSIMSDSVDIDSALAPLTLTHFLKHNYAYIKILFVNAYPIQLKSWSMKDLVEITYLLLWWETSKYTTIWINHLCPNAHSELCEGNPDLPGSWSWGLVSSISCSWSCLWYLMQPLNEKYFYNITIRNVKCFPLTINSQKYSIQVYCCCGVAWYDVRTPSITLTPSNSCMVTLHYPLSLAH